MGYVELDLPVISEKSLSLWESILFKWDPDFYCPNMPESSYSHYCSELAKSHISRLEQVKSEVIAKGEEIREMQKMLAEYDLINED